MCKSVLRRISFYSAAVVTVIFLVGCTNNTMMHTPTVEDIDTTIDAGYPSLAVDLTSPLLKERKLILTTDLNALSARTVMASLMYLDGLDPGTPIDFYINTNGGDLDACLAIIQIMRQIKSPVNTHAMVDVKSGGVLLVAAGTGKRIGYRSSLFTVHGGVASANTPMDYKAKALGVYEHEIERSMKLPAEWFPLQGHVFHTMTATEALKYHVIDQINMPIQE